VQRGARGDGEEPVSIEGPPPLARMAALMALVDLFWNRIVVRVAASADQDLGISLQRAGVFPRNLAAVAALVALIGGLYTFLRMAGYAGLFRRLSVSSVAGLLMPAFVLAIVIPKERVSILVVVVALAASNLLVVLLGSVAVQYAAGLRRWASACATASGALVLTVLVVASVRSIAESSAAAPIGALAHYGGEVAWHSILVLSLFALFRAHKGASRSEGAPPGRLALGMAGLLVVLILAASLYGESRLHAHRFATLVYGALRLTLAPESVAWLNGLPVGIGVAAALVGLFSSSAARVQIGAAAALWLAAGYAPRAPGQLLDFALAGLLLARAAQAASIEGRARARIAWAPITAPATDP
jgi:hypothetical protein